MITALELDSLLKQIQEETPNCGGTYHFTKVAMTDFNNVYKSVKDYMLRFEKHREPYYVNKETGEKTYMKWWDPENLAMKKIEDFNSHLSEKLDYWSKHKTSLDCRDDITEHYKPLEAAFKESLTTFLSSENILSVHTIEFVDTIYCFGFDHMNDDTLIHTSGGFYILHFGWSS